jgi:ATP-binding cassette subfamily B protein
LNKQIGKEFDGLEFSGGEWQKIAIGRAFFKDDAKIYVMDEPTSALDAIVEEKVLNNFINETNGRTAIIISHRLSLTKKVDRVIFMENGQIVEEGSHKALMAKNGKYAAMFKSQQKWYR